MMTQLRHQHAAHAGKIDRVGDHGRHDSKSRGNLVRRVRLSIMSR
jgi:hypothetical protein